MKVTILEWHAVAAWRWDMPSDDLCGICRVPFDGTCPKCKYPGDDCTLVVGQCAHSFHMHCLDTWLHQDSSQGKCPMCRQVFRYKGEGEGEAGTGETGRVDGAEEGRNEQEGGGE